MIVRIYSATTPVINGVQRGPKLEVPYMNYEQHLRNMANVAREKALKEWIGEIFPNLKKAGMTPDKIANILKLYKAIV